MIADTLNAAKAVDVFVPLDSLPKANGNIK